MLDPSFPSSSSAAADVCVRTDVAGGGVPIRREKPPKTARSKRTLSVGSLVLAALECQKKEQEERRAAFGLPADDDAFVFDRADGQPWNPDSFSWSFAELIRRSKLPKVRAHHLRHSHATISLAAGTDLKAISAALRHSTIAVTANTYLHATESLQQLHAERIDEALEGAVSELSDAEAGKSAVPLACHEQPLTTKKARGYELLLVAPTGFEPVLPP